MKAALLPLLLLGACMSKEQTGEYRAGHECWAQHRDYTICYAKCAAMYPRERAWGMLCVQGVDAAGSDKGEPKP